MKTDNRGKLLRENVLLKIKIFVVKIREEKLFLVALIAVIFCVIKIICALGASFEKIKNLWLNG